MEHLSLLCAPARALHEARQRAADRLFGNAHFLSPPPELLRNRVLRELLGEAELDELPLLFAQAGDEAAHDLFLFLARDELLRRRIDRRQRLELFCLTGGRARFVLAELLEDDVLGDREEITFVRREPGVAVARALL